jgi:hypothetical protein
MISNNICWICQGKFPQPFATEGDRTIVDCRTCGVYAISGSQLASSFPLPDSERHRMSYWCKLRQLERRNRPLLDPQSLPAIIAQLPAIPTHSKPDVLLRSLTLLYPEPGATFKIDSTRDKSLRVLVTSASWASLSTHYRSGVS